MKIEPYIQRLNSSDEYREFQKKHSDAFMVAGFFILDFESGQNVHQIDYYVPSEKKIAAFTLDKHITIQLLDLLNKKAPEKLDTKTNIDLEAIHGIIEDEMKNRNITEEIKKIIAVLQNVGGKKIWSINCILSGMGLLSAHLEDDSKTILKMEKKSLFNYMQKMQMPVQAADPVKQLSKNEAEERIKKLDELEKAIEKEKEKLKNTKNIQKNKGNRKKQNQKNDVPPRPKGRGL